MFNAWCLLSKKPSQPSKSIVYIPDMCKASWIVLNPLLSLCAFMERKIGDIVNSLHLIVFIFSLSVENLQYYQIECDTIYKVKQTQHIHIWQFLSEYFCPSVYNRVFWLNSAETHQCYLCAVWQTLSHTPEVIFFLCTLCKQSLLSCHRIFWDAIGLLREMICQGRLDLAASPYKVWPITSRMLAGPVCIEMAREGDKCERTVLLGSLAPVLSCYKAEPQEWEIVKGNAFKVVLLTL